MIIRKDPFFFTDDKFKADISSLPGLIALSEQAGREMPDTRNTDIEPYNEEESEQFIQFAIKVTNTSMLIMEVISYLLKKIYADEKLSLEYSQYTIPLPDIIQAQILQYFSRDKTIEELLPVVERNKETVVFINKFVERNDPDNK